MTKKKYASAKAKMVFYGCQTISGAPNNCYRYRKNYVAVENPDTVVQVSIVVPSDHWQRKNRINLDEEFNKLAKPFFPKAEIFMFYNRVSAQGINVPPPPPPKANTFTTEKKFS